jgi:hypothetical protein
MMVRASDLVANRAVMQLTFQWRCATCGREDDANPGVCPGCGAPAGPPTLAEAWNRDHPGDPMLASAPARRRPRPPATVSRSRPERATAPRSRPERAPAPQRRWSPLAIASPVGGILLGVALWSTGMFDPGSSKPSTPASAVATSHRTRPPPSTAAGTPAKPKPKPSAANAALGAHRVFAGQAFSVAYPQGWTVQSAETAAPWGTDTTIVAPSDPHTMLRIDVTTNPATGDPITAAEPVIASVGQQPGYRELGLTNGTFDGRPAAQWEFVVAESGVLLHKQDVFLTSPSGAGIAILTSAPAGAYASLAGRFAALRRSLAAH